MIHLFTLATILLFFGVYFTGRTRLVNTVLFFFMLASIDLSFAYEALEHNNFFARIIFLILTIPVLAVVALGFLLYFFILLYLIYNGLTLWRREGRALRNSLSLGFTLFVIADGLIYGYFSPAKIPEWLRFILNLGNSFLIYSLIIFFCFYFSSILYRLYRPHFDKDFIIVLGSGLINGERVPPLLASRIQRALDFRSAQLAKTQKAATLIFSGGQGPDEKVSEAYAMSQYALEQGLPLENCLLEDKSRTTEENLANSAKMMRQNAPEGYKAAFSTNNFHVLRAAIYAQRQHLKIDGLSAKTAFYFLPNAFTREYIAYLVMYKWVHVCMLLLITLGMIASVILNHYVS